jgi:hypothetical protein
VRFLRVSAGKFTEYCVSNHRPGKEGLRVGGGCVGVGEGESDGEGESEGEGDNTEGGARGGGTFGG